MTDTKLGPKDNEDNNNNKGEALPQQFLPQISACPTCQTKYKLTYDDLSLRTICRKCGCEFHLLPPAESPPTVIIDPTSLDNDNMLQVGNLWLDLRCGQIVEGTVEVLDIIGRGGLSQVFKVRHLNWGLNMALKVPKPSTLDNIPIDLLHSEAQVWLKAARHPNLVTCHYISNLMDRPAIFLEYVNGDTLAGMLLSQNGKKPKLYDHSPIESQMGILDLFIQAA
ncbi:MAG: protein kinase domain-containing protein, partial [Candidatus Adiutrix sp.]